MAATKFGDIRAMSADEMPMVFFSRAAKISAR